MPATSDASAEDRDYDVISGYDNVFLHGHNNLCFSRDKRLLMLDVYEGERRTACLEMNGTITALTVTSDFKYFVACLSDRLEENFSIIVFNAQNDLQEDVSFSCEVAADVLRTDDSHETLIAFAPSKTRNTATIACYILQSGHKIAAVELDNHEKSDVWEITLCPTDEHIMCVLSSSTAYLLRNTGTVIQTFSSISLYGVTCHVWSTDVTMAFATQDGSILFYRETLALDKVDLSTTLKAYLTESEVCVTSLVATKIFFFATVANRLVLMFPVISSRIQWDKARAILVRDRNYHCSFISVFMYLRCVRNRVPSIF
ncbi:hypothetical protein QR680_001703 [Steinernema hermaphroditum]|uniref:Uncharacterized protein n=1 Tax=Steinernema hermaphroditum TaxID=289476 RepID=A0AA39LGK7_9BILA|nr:hypothetical protein QR680_001703 [Steinernema hermaphroditum]